MYANHATSQGTRAASFGGALLVNGAIILGLVFAAPVFVKRPPQPPIIGTMIEEQQPPPPVPDEKPVDRQRTAENPVTIPDTIVDPQVDNRGVTGTPDINDHPVVRDLGEPKADDRVNTDPPPIPPLLVAQIDPRFANAFQPEYPSSEIRLGREGRVQVRVLIGADGRVKAVEQVSATSAAFFQATRRHAIANWRFRPATRGGQPEESWKVMSVKFELTGG